MASVFVCGVECGSTLDKVALVGVAAISTATVRTGQRSYTCAQVGSAAFVQHFLNAAAATSVVRFYVRWSTLPTSAGTDWTFVLALVSAGTAPKVTVTSTGVIKFGYTSLVTHGTTVTTGVWYRFDFRALNNDGSGTKKMDLQIDGVTATQATIVEAGSNVTAWRVGGPGAAITQTIFWDDWIIGDNTADYPFGEGQVDAVYPNADGTHSFTAGDFGDDAGTILSSTTTAYQKINESLMPLDGAALSAAFLEQIVLRTTGYLEFAFDTSPITGDPKGIAVTAAVQAETAATTSAYLKVNDNGTVEAAATIGAFPALTTIRHSYKVVALRPSTGTAWTAASMSTLKVRWGFSDDANPDVRLDSLIVEIDHLPVVAAGFPYVGGGYYPA